MVVAVSRMVYNSEMSFRAAQAQRARGDLRKGYRPYDTSG